jgi:hypothetical protein
MEHRWGTRIDLDAPAELWTTEGIADDAWIRNASLSGAFVETTARVPLLSRIAIRAAARPGEWLDSCVVRVEASGLALEWLDPGLHQVSALLALRGEPQPRATPGIERNAKRDAMTRIFRERPQPPL